MKTTTNFDEIEFALNNPDDGMMGDALKALEIVRAEFAAMRAVVEAARLEHLAICGLIAYTETPANRRINLDVRDVLYPARECRFNTSMAFAGLDAVKISEKLNSFVLVSHLVGGAK